MDEDLAGGSTAAAGATPAAGSPGAAAPSDWNTSLAGPAATSDFTAPGATTTGGGSAPSGARTDAGSRPAPRAPRKPQPDWQEPATLPGVQRAHTGQFGEKLRALQDAASTVREVMASIDVETLTDPEVVALTQMVERAGRPVDAARVRTATVVAYRSRRGLGRESLAWRLGSSHQTDLLTRLTGTSGAEVKRRVNLGEKTAPRTMAGRVLEPVFAVVAAAMDAGELSVDAAETIVKGLADYKSHGRFDANQTDVDGCEAALVESATGSIFGRTPGPGDTAAADADAGTECTGPVGRLGDSEGSVYGVDALHGMALQWQAFLNPDGVAPTAAVPEAKSSFSFGRLTNGLYPLRGGVTPELKGIIHRLFDAHLSARSAPAFPSAAEQERIEAGELVPGEVVDERSGGEKRADILRGVLTQVAQDPRTPTMGGMPPTVMVHVSAADLLAGVGVGWIDGIDGPVSMTTINQMVDNGGIRPVFFGGNGSVLALGNKARCFTPMQRKAITARDGGCVIDNCTCPPQWTEIHHVTAWQDGGATDVSNGVLLCWYHHHTINSSGWQIRMVLGMPEVKAPSWIDPTGVWRKARQHRAHDPRTRRPPHTE